MGNVKFEIKDHIGILNESNSSWKKELNIVSWNEREPKYDIRDWDSEHQKMGKGITLNNQELKKLKEILNNMQI